MASDCVSTVGEVAEFRNSLRKPVTAIDRRPGPYPYYGAATIQDWVDGYLFDGLHVLVGEDGTVQTPEGRPLIQVADGKFWVNNHAHVLRCESPSDTRFLAYALNQVQIAPFVTGAAQPKLNMGNLKRVPVSWPEPHLRKEVAEIGGSLDERICLLRKTNSTLEAIAQALFKSWFVDFDPVRAKAEGREPEGMDAGTAALFPSEFEGSELGPIPMGWRVAELADHIDAERGLSYKGAGLASFGQGKPMHNLNSVLEGGGYKYEGIKYYSGDYKERHLTRAGDILVANTEQGHQHRLIGFPAIVPRRYSSGLFSHHLYRVRPKSGSGLATEWVYRCLMVPAVRDQIIGCANGSTVNMLKPAGLQIPRFVVPPVELTAEFARLGEAMRARAECSIERVESLESLRDTLLPRLISGKLRLSEGKATAGSVAP